MNMFLPFDPRKLAAGTRSAPAPSRTARRLRRLVVAGLLALALAGGGAFGALAATHWLASEPADPDPSWLLPDLQTVSPRDLSIEGDRASGDRVLRFGTTVVNAGEGPLEMVGTYDPATDRTQAIQRVRTREGGMVERSVGSFVFHPGHRHWHFEDFTMFELWSHRPDGSLEELLATSGKMTFCLRDTDRVAPSLPDAAPRASFTACGEEVQGISVGWGDTYGPSLPGQELDIGDLPDGRYAVRSTADPDNRLVETDETNNSAIGYVEVGGTSIQVLAGP